MRRALEIAAQGRGRVSPNPMVGAVVVKNGEIISEGWHRRAGGPHAEIDALNSLGGAAPGATMYVNLEPCSHSGKTPPCAPAVVKSGVSTVVVGMTDPNPLVAGRGVAILREAGLEVVSGVLENECLRLNEVFIKYITTGLPFVVLKGAITLDGKIASSTGDSKWISSEESRRKVHEMRSEYDAAIVGVSTLIADDASLTCRIPGKIKDPHRVVLDSALRAPAGSNFFKLAADGKSVAVGTSRAPAERIKAMEAAGVKVLIVESDKAGRPAPEAALRALAAIGITSALLEGGGDVNFSFINAGLVDRVVAFVAPRILGGKSSASFVGGEGFATVEESVKLKDIFVEKIGDDLMISGYPVKTEAESSSS